MNILLTSAGRRVSLLRLIQNAAKSYGKGLVLAADKDITAPTMHVADKSFIVPDVESPNYVQKIIEIAKNNRIDLIIPLIDSELLLFSEHFEEFKKNGINLMLSNNNSVRIADDKMLTYGFFKKIDIPVPYTTCSLNGDRLSSFENLSFPVVIKPRRGSSSIGVHVCQNEHEILFYLDRTNGDYVIQDLVNGTEVTIDVFGDGNGDVLSMVPRKRLKIRAGEVERAVTVDDEIFRKHILKIAENFKPFGAINIQCIVNQSGLYFTEINARFGGGYPLSDRAGARFPQLLLEIIYENKANKILGQYKRSLIMSRYDAEVFKDSTDLFNVTELSELPYKITR